MRVEDLIISADGHVDESKTMWERLPRHLRERAMPYSEEHADGVLFNALGRQVLMSHDVIEGRTEEDREREFRNDPTGGADLEVRIAKQAADGVHAEVIFPNELLALGSLYDPELNFALARVYNEWVYEIFSPMPKRYLPVGLIPTDEIGRALAEAERCLAEGFRTLMVPCSNAWLPYDRPVYEPLWSLVEEAGVPLNFHVFTGNVFFGTDFAALEDMTTEEFEARRAAAARYAPEHVVERLSTTVLGMVAGMGPLVHLTGGGVLERHPDLRFVITEGEAGWLAWALYAMDAMQERRQLGLERLGMKPSQYFLRQGALTFSDDPVALRNLELTGSDCLMWGNDYPHDEGTYPRSEKFREEVRASVDEEEAHAIFAGNAARIYGFDLDALARTLTSESQNSAPLID
jgi:predicted TIM-barrel fold metal-dependent hydrolase